jgi:hypothetical protein
MEAQDNLTRRKGEPKLQHRALLLYAMMHPDHRSMREVAHLCGRALATVRDWKTRREWDARLHAPMTEECAVAMYRLHYMSDHGATDLPQISERIKVPLNSSVQEAPPPTVVEDLRRADAIAKQEILRRRSQRKAVRAQHVQLVDGALGYVVQEMQAGRIRASLKDIPALLNARHVLTGEAGTGASTGIGTETVRVRQARATGGSVIEAMRQDLGELEVILTALESREHAAQEPEEQQVAEGGGAAAPPSLTVVADPDDDDD